MQVLHSVVYVRRVPRRKILFTYLTTLHPPVAAAMLYKTLQFPALRYLPMRYPKRRKAIYTLMLAHAPSAVSVPNVVGLSTGVAVFSITSIGLTVGTETTAFSSTVAAGFIISQTPTPGSTVGLGTPVSLVISLGAAPVPVPVPNVLGQAQIVAAANLVNAGFTVNVNTAFVPGATLGTVAVQIPTPGALEFLPFTVTITIAVSPTWPTKSAVTNLQVRGTWVLPGGKQALWAIANQLYLMTVTLAGNFQLASVGNLLTTMGQVCIRDNGAGGHAFIVDGPNGYLYEIATQKFRRIVDPGFLGADRCCFIDGWMVFNWPGTQTFYTTGPVPYTTTFPGSFFALKDGATDHLVSLMENKEELWLIGERTTEIWYNAGGQYFAFARLVSTMIQTGCSAKHSVSRYASGNESGLVWLGLSERGQNIVVKTEGFAVVSITTPAVADALSQYARVDDAFGYVYVEDGHEFYILTFPSADATWCYDFSTQLWHKRASYDPYQKAFHRHRSNCFANFQNQRLVGDYQNGSIYQMTRAAYTDAGWPILARRRTPHIWDGSARGRVFMGDLQVEFAPGVGNQVGLGVDPQAILTLSRDGGTTFGSEFPRSLGQVGQYKNRCIWRRMGFARDTVINVDFIAPVKRDIVGANLRRFGDG